MKPNYDVLVVGTGAAGLYAALQFDESVSVLLISKRELELCNSALAQGGVAAVLDTEHDDYRLHIADTLIAGGYENDLAALKVLVTEGPEDVRNLISMGADFDRDENGEPSMTLEGGHSRRRIVHHKDSTGFEIVKTLVEKVKARPNVDILENTMLCDLQPVRGGFHAHLLRNGTIHSTAVGYTLLATGGIGRVYKYTTNSAIATGDGIQIAHHLGAKIKNLHYVQFHPTAFASEGREQFLMSEAVRGEGAYLLNCDGERFMDRYDERLELAPRDVVSLSIILESRRTGSESFFLDISHKDADFIKNRFPLIYSRCLDAGVDMTKEPIPIFPCQHYLMGGIQVDIHSRTTVERLYAAGECSHTGVHGKNRLASNSLLEALVFGRRAAEDIMKRLNEGRPAIPPAAGMDMSQSAAPLPKGMRTRIRDIMQHAYFVIPDLAAARDGLREVTEIKNRLYQGHFQITMDYLEAKSLATVAWIILSEVSEA